MAVPTRETRKGFSRFGYSVSRDTLNEDNFKELRTDVDDTDHVTVAYKEIEDDEGFRLGQGQDRGPEYTSGRVYLEIPELSDNADVEIVELSSQNNVKSTIDKAKYGQFNTGEAERGKRRELPEQGKHLFNPRRIGIRIEEASGESTDVDLSECTFRIDAIRGEK